MADRSALASFAYGLGQGSRNLFDGLTGSGLMQQAQQSWNQPGQEWKAPLQTMQAMGAAGMTVFGAGELAALRNAGVGTMSARELTAVRATYVGDTGNLAPREPIILDLFGGRASQTPGAINVDILAQEGVRASAMQLPFKSNAADRVIASNPYIPGGNGMMDFLPEATRVLKPDGQLIINSTVRNPFGVLPDAEALNSLGLRVIQNNGPLLPQFENNVFRITDGRVIPSTSVRSTVLQKVSP